MTIDRGVKGLKMEEEEEGRKRLWCNNQKDRKRTESVVLEAELVTIMDIAQKNVNSC